jgi:hypothetical protein
MKKISFKIPIYNGKVLLVYTNDFLKVGRKFGVQFEVDINSCKGLAYKVKDNKYLILIKKYRADDLDTLVHECLHITNYILKDKGVIVDIENDEAQTYLLGYIMGKIQSKKIWNKKQK